MNRFIAHLSKNYQAVRQWNQINNESVSIRVSVLILTIIIYLLGIVLLYQVDADVANILAVIPICVVGWLYGLRMGVFAGLIISLLGMGITNMLDPDLPLPHDVIDLAIMVMVGAMIGKLSDITKLLSFELAEHKRAEAELAAERRLLFTMIDNLPDQIYVKDINGHFMVCNQAYVTAIGLKSPRDIIGKQLSDFLHSDLALRSEFTDKDVLQSGQSLLQIEESIITDDKQKKWYSITKVPFRNSHGDIIGLIGLTIDVTNRKLADIQKYELVLEQEKNAVFRELVKDISHDLRTPLAIMQSSLDLLTRQTDPIKKQRHVEKITNAINRIDELLDQILKISDLDRANSEFNIAPCDLNTVVQLVVDNDMPLAVPKNHHIALDMEADLQTIQANSNALVKAIHHLFINAINFTPDGGTITIRTYTKENNVVFEIKDNGIGINSQDLSNIFDYFYKADKTRNIEKDGAGLGLSMVNKIIRIHGGTVTVESEEGKGSLFIVSLPQIPDNSEQNQ